MATVWASCKDGHYLLHMWRGRVEFPDLIKVVKELSNRWKPRYVLIENAGSGQSLYQELKRNTQLPVLAVKPQGDKQERAHSVTPEFETGRVFLPKEPRWREDFEYELEVFPRGEHDDIVDSVVQYLIWAKGKKQGARVLPIRGLPSGYQRPRINWRDDSIWR